MIQRFLLISIGYVVALFNSEAFAADQLRIVGSSTVYPFSASVAEHFGKAGDFKTPVVEATGTGAGFKLFCSGTGASFPYITNASRAILPSERDYCAKNGIHKILEAKFGFDGITIANSLHSPLFHLSRKQLFLALIHDVPGNGKLVPNYYEKWNQVDPSLPNLPIKIYGSPPVSGTYDTFLELVMKKGCLEVQEYASMPENERERQCRTLREDGKFIEAGENGNLIAEKLINDPAALGIIGFSFLDQNAGKIQASVIDGQAPTFESIQNSSYPISRPLYFYIKETTPLIPGIREYIKEFMSDAAIGDEGYLIPEGLVPLPKAEREKVRNELAEKIK